jgi:hypothetical protein
MKLRKDNSVWEWLKSRPKQKELTHSEKIMQIMERERQRYEGIRPSKQ